MSAASHTQFGEKKDEREQLVKTYSKQQVDDTVSGQRWLQSSTDEALGDWLGFIFHSCPWFDFFNQHCLVLTHFFIGLLWSQPRTDHEQGHAIQQTVVLHKWPNDLR